MKPFDVFANMIAAFVVWIMLTAIACFFVIWSIAPDGEPVWVGLVAILVASGWSYSLYAKRYWKKLDS